MPARGFVVSLPAWRGERAGTYFFLPATCFATIACCFFTLAPLALACFCDACLFVDFGDLSPMMFIFRLMVSSPAAFPVFSEGNTTIPLYGRFCKRPKGDSPAKAMKVIWDVAGDTARA